MRSFLVVLLIIVFALGVCLTKEFYDKLDRYLISCHTTDFKCFKRQYVSLRDHVLLGSLKMNIPDFEPLYVQYGDTGTCIKMTGFEESQLVGIGIDSENKEYSMVLELPLKLQQVENISTCEVPEKAFHDIPLQEGPLKKFSGNASIQVVYPYELKKKKSQVYMLLGEEGLDVILDIPDLTDLKLLSKEDQREYELSEWAYDVVEHINAAQVFALPFTSRMRLFTDRIPMEKFLLLYPEEEYTDVNFQYCESPFFKIGHLSTVKSEYDQTI